MSESLNGLKVLSDMDYPGRFIMLGRADNCDVVAVYGITGRSTSSQARRLVKKNVWEKGFSIHVEPTDPELIISGNQDLLIYPAIIVEKNDVVVSNGRQTEDLLYKLEYNNPLHSLVIHHKNWDYEPDHPNYTPRITGCIKDEKAALGIIKRSNSGMALRQLFEIELFAGKGKLIATYTGKNMDPLPSFTGEPLSVNLERLTESASTTAKSFYDALAPKNPALDFRVSVAAVHKSTRREIDISIINRADLEKK
ncbi:MAG: IMP cyclohydrolase [Nanoarchaeota archaeon]